MVPCGWAGGDGPAAAAGIGLDGGGPAGGGGGLAGGGGAPAGGASASADDGDPPPQQEPQPPTATASHHRYRRCQNDDYYSEHRDIDLERRCSNQSIILYQQSQKFTETLLTMARILTDISVILWYKRLNKCLCCDPSDPDM